MTKVNGNGGMSNFFLKLNPLHTSKTNESAKTEQTSLAQNTEATSTTFDFSIGAKQTADQIRGFEVEGVKKIPPADQADLNQLAQLAGLKSVSVPQNVYNRIGNTVVNVTNVMDTIEVENNAQELFGSEEFQTLNNLFGI